MVFIVQFCTVTTVNSEFQSLEPHEQDAYSFTTDAYSMQQVQLLLDSVASMEVFRKTSQVLSTVPILHCVPSKKVNRKPGNCIQNTF